MSYSFSPNKLTADQAFSRNGLLTKAQLVAHIVVSVLIFFISSSVLVNTNRELRLGIIADFQGLSALKWMALISCVLALMVIGLCAVLFAVSLIGEPSRLKRTFDASFEAKVLRVFEFTTSGTVLYGGLLSASIAQAALGLLMARAGSAVPAFRTLGGQRTYRTAIKEGPTTVAVLGLVATAVTGFGMWYRSGLKDNYNSKYLNPVAKAVGTVGGIVGQGANAVGRVIGAGVSGVGKTVGAVGGLIGGGISEVGRGYSASRDWFYNTPPSTI